MKKITHVFFDRDNTISYRTKPSNLVKELADVCSVPVWDILEPMFKVDYTNPDGFVALL